MLALLALASASVHLTIDVTKSRQSRPPTANEIVPKDSSIPLVDVSDSMFYGNVKIGTPAQTFKIDFDTGSSTLWVPTTECEDCGHHNQFDASASSTLETSETPIELRYGTGSCSGKLAHDTVSLGGLALPKTPIGLMTSEAQPFPQSPMDGLLGLAFDGISQPEGTPTVLDMLAKQSKEDLQFAFKMEKGAKEGELLFGGVDALYSGGINWVDVQEYQGRQAYWMMSVDSIKIGEQSGQAQQGMVDSGTTCLAMPEADFETFKQQISEQPPCSGEGVPSLTLTIGGTDYTLEGKDLMLQVEGHGCQLCVSPMQTDFYILGDIFHEKFQVAYDYTNKKVGLPKVESVLVV